MVYFKEVYYALLKRHFYHKIFLDASEGALKEINTFERKFYYELEESKIKEAVRKIKLNFEFYFFNILSTLIGDEYQL
jgi:hypothetical protein